MVKSDFEYRRRPTRDDCPSPETLVLCARSVLPKREKTQITDHIATCYDCTQEVKSLLVIFNEENKLISDIKDFKTAQINKKPRAFGLPAWRPAWNIVSAAFLVILLAAMAVISISRFSPRAAQQRGAVPSIDLVSPVDKAYASSDLKFIWKGRPDSKYYVVEVFDASLNLLWRSPSVFGNEVMAPEELAHKLKPEETYLWMVTAVLENEAMIRSKLREFETKE